MDWATELDRQLAERLPELAVLEDEMMARHTSFRVGGPARRMAFPETGEQLAALLPLARACGARPLVLGRGTNVLAPDGGLDRLVVVTGRLDRIELGEEPGTIAAPAGAALASLADFACKRGLTGLEFAHGIPGTVGGGLCMNAGAYGGELSQVVCGAAVLFPEEGVRALSREELRLGYRRSILTDCPQAAALSVTFRLETGEPEEIRETMRDLMERRRARQPLDLPSAGSFFKRPEGAFAGALIQQCGLMGLTVGGAQVSEKHAGFLVNRGGATCGDILALAERVQERVLAETGVRLEREVRLLEP